MRPALEIRGWPLALAILAAFAPVSLAARPQTGAPNRAPRSSPPRTTKEITRIHVQSPLVVVRFAVMDRSGNFMERLGRRDVRVLDDGVRQRVKDFGLAAQPVACVIVVQSNRAAAPSLASVHPLAPLFTDLLLGKSGKSATVIYADRVRQIEPFSSGEPALQKALQSLKADGTKARLNDALLDAVRMLANQTKTGRRVIIVFSDGSDSGSATSPAEVIRAASNANVKIYGVRFQPSKEAAVNYIRSGALSRVYTKTAPPPGTPGTAPGISGLSPAGGPDFGTTINLMPLAILALKMAHAELRKNVVGQYAGYTGGVSYTPWKNHSIQDMLQRIALEINSEYVLTYVPRPAGKTGFHPIQVEVRGNHRAVLARAGYFY